MHFPGARPVRASRDPDDRSSRDERRVSSRLRSIRFDQGAAVLLAAFLVGLPLGIESSKSGAQQRRPSGPVVPGSRTPPARPVPASYRLPDFISTTGARGLNMGQVISALTITQKAGARSGVLHQATIEGLRVLRGSTVIQSFPAGSVVPLSFLASSPDTAEGLLTKTVSIPIARGDVVLSQTSARLRKAQPGDTIELRGWNNVMLPVLVAAVVPDTQVFDAEIYGSIDLARRLGVDRPQRLLTWSFRGSRDRLAKDIGATLREIGVRVTPSWDRPRRDRLLSQAQLKEALGEFTLIRRGSTIDIDPAWLRANIVSADLPLLGRKSCHRKLIEPLRAALNDLVYVGIRDLVDVRDTNRAGGCFNGREIRSAGGTSGRNLSRHSWAGAIDINPSTNAFGAKPTMHPCMVEIFRARGFAWGGTFTIPDGMHFEYVRTVTNHTLPRCATEWRLRNLTSTTTSTTTTSTTTTTVAPTTTVTTMAPTTTPRGRATTSAPVAAASTVPPITAPLPPSAASTLVPSASTASSADVSTTQAPTSTARPTTTIRGRATTTTSAVPVPTATPPTPPTPSTSLNATSASVPTVPVPLPPPGPVQAAASVSTTTLPFEEPQAPA